MSGYLITRIILTDLDSGQFSFANFWIRRARRILPALLFMLLSVTLVALVVLLPDDLNQYGQLLSHTVVFAANIFLANERGYFDPDGLGSPLLHVWPLAVEEQYYLIWPLLLVSLQLFKRLHVVGGVLVLCCISLVYSEWASINFPKIAFFSLPSRAFELLMGAGLAAAGLRQVKSAALREALSICGVLLVCSGFVFIDETSRFPGIPALIPCFGAALLIFSGGQGTKTCVERLLSSPIFVRVGKISYSWYLWHWPPLAFARYCFEQPQSNLVITVALAIGLGMAMVSWRFVESPFRRPVSPPEFKSSFFPLAISSSVLLLALGTAFQTFNGIPARLDKGTQAMLSEFEKKSSLGCTDTSKTVLYFRECIFGKPDAVAPTILLWGDSHAGHYLPAVAEIAAIQGVKGVAHISHDCRPLIAPDAIDRATAMRRACPKFNEETLVELAARPEISVVVLAARWSAKEILSGEANKLATFNVNFERTITALERMGKRVIVLGQVPQLPLSLKACMTKQLRFGVKLSECETVSLSLVNGYQTNIWTSFHALSLKHSQAVFFAPQHHLCNAHVCRATDEQGLPLYKDDDHLSVRGALLLQPYLSAAIAQVVRSSLPYIVHTTLP